MTTISDGTTTITPVLTLGYESSRDSRNIFHDVIGRDYPDVTLRAASLRHGTLTYLFETEADSLACEQLHRADSTFTVTDDDRDSIGMAYVVSGSITRTLDDDTRDLWTVAVDFQEIQP